MVTLDEGHNSLDFKIPKKPPKKQSINSDDIECACIEIVRNNVKNVIVSCIYGPLRGNSHKLLNEIKTIICKKHEKPFFLLNLNFSDYSINRNVCDFFNLVFQNGVFSLVNSPTRVTKSSATIIGHVLNKR